MFKTAAGNLLYLLLAVCAGQGTLHAQRNHELNVVFPQPGDTVEVARVRYAGSSSKDSRILVQGREVRVYPSGAFVGMVDLVPGWNLLRFRSQSTHGTDSRELRVFRKFDPAYPADPTAVRAASVFPAGDLFIVAEEELAVGFSGSAQGKASARLVGTEQTIALHDEKPDASNNFHGRYSGHFKIPVAQLPAQYRVQFRFLGRDGREFRFEAPGAVNVLPADTPRLAVTRDSSNFLLSEPEGDFLMELPAGLPLRVTSREGAFYRVRLSRDNPAYVDSGSLTLQPPQAIDTGASLNSISVLDELDWITLKLDLSRKTAYQIRQNVRPARLDVVLFYTQKNGKWQVATDRMTLLKSVQTSRENGSSLRVRIRLPRQPQWGYRARYFGDVLFVSIRKQPVPLPANRLPLSGLTVAVDPGHGGEARGSISATGILEKDANLSLALKVAALLRQAGALTTMTRSEDTTVTFDDRLAAARTMGADMMLSIHHNSIPPGVDPLRVRGTGVYHTMPQSRALAGRIYRQLQRSGLKSFGLREESFLVTRQTDFLSVLVEGAFLTHPEDEMLILADGFVEKTAAAIVAGVEQFYHAK